MAANPITYQEIEAYRRLALNPLRAWDVQVIKRLDLAVLAAMGRNAPATPVRPDQPATFRVDDAKGVRALFADLKARVNAREAQRGKADKAPPR